MDNKEQIDKAQNYLDSRQFNGVNIAEIMVEFAALSQPKEVDLEELSDLKIKYYAAAGCGDLQNETDLVDVDSAWDFFLPHLQKPVEKSFSLEDMYLVSSYVVDCIAANRGNSDWNMKTTPKMIADDYIKTLPLQKHVHCNIVDELIEAAKYGYEYRDTTSFPKNKFEDCCINNFKQLLQSKGYKV